MKKVSTKQKIALVLFGLFLCVLLLEGGLRIGGFLYISLQEYRNIQSLKQGGEYRILCLGESTTANQWPGPLEDILNQSKAGVQFSVIDKGVPGTNSGVIVTHLPRYLDTYKPHMVITMMGINDGENVFVLPYQPGKVSLKTLRTYKFIRLLKLYISRKYKEIGAFFKQKRELSAIANQKTIKGAGALTVENEVEKKTKKTALNKEDLDKLEWVYANNRKLDKEEAMLKDAITLNPKNDWGYIELGRFYRDKGKLDIAEALFKEAIAINPMSDWGYIELGGGYIDEGKLDKAEALFKEAITIDPKSGWGYIGLLRCYIDQERFNKAEALFKEAITISPGTPDALLELVNVYTAQEKFDTAETLFTEVIQMHPENEAAIHALTQYKQQCILNHQRENTDPTSLGFDSPDTAANYRRLAAIVTTKNLQLVCVQYPMQSVAPLMRMLKNQEGAIFVDNEGVSKEALKGVSRAEYFTDVFVEGGGHCTFKGNRLLAQNIADTILDEYFNKEVK